MNVSSYILPRPHALRRDAALIFGSGFLAAQAMATITYGLPLVGVGQVDLPTWTIRLFVDDPARVVILGLALHLFLGLGYAWLFAEQIEPRLRAGSAWAGLLFGAVLWAFAQTIAVPLLGVFGGADPSPGFLAVRLGPGAALASLIAHLAYGGTLGFVSGCHWGGRCRSGAGKA